MNQAVWSSAGEVRRLASASGWIDPSERRLFQRVIEERPDADVLDIGVGGGRTVPLLAPRASSFIGIDFIPDLVEAARTRFPTTDLREGDARRLEFDDGQFEIASFSINGIDAIGHADRARALGEVRRVLRRDGVFVFSTHNFDGPGRSDRPWRLPPMTIRQPRSSVRALLRRVSHERRSLTNYRALHSLDDSGSGWAIGTSGAHDFGILVHYISSTLLIEELRSAGFDGVIEIWDDRVGVPVDGSDTQRCWYFNVLAYCS